MYPVGRLLYSSYRATKKPPLKMDEVGEMEFICRPWDVDMFLEMNNGRILTLYDLGRFDLAIRAGLTRVLKEKGWGLAVAGSSVRYRKRIRMFDWVKIRTQLVGVEDRWFFMAQSMWVRGRPMSSVLLRTCITGEGRCLPVETVLTEMGVQEWPQPLPQWVADWAHADQTRPWPPVP